VGQRIELEVMVGASCQILNQTAPLGFQVVTLWPAGTLAKYAMAGPGWKMLGLEETAAWHLISKATTTMADHGATTY